MLESWLRQNLTTDGDKRATFFILGPILSQSTPKEKLDVVSKLSTQLYRPAGVQPVASSLTENVTSHGIAKNNT